MTRLFVLTLLLLATLASVCQTTGGAGGVDSPCQWRVTATRNLMAGEVPLTQRHPRLADSESANDAPGPDSSRLVVHKGIGRKPAVHLEYPSRGTSEVLIERASGPRASADGRFVACTVWMSQERPWTLVVLDLKSKRRIEPNLDGCASPYRWSPDGRWIAVMVTPCQEPKSRLALVRMPAGEVRWVDSLEVFSDYEFDWSPDSRHLVVARPTAIDHASEEPTAADLWIVATDGQRPCLLTATPAHVEHDPKWLSHRTIQVDRFRRENGRFVGEDRVVLEVQEE